MNNDNERFGIKDIYSDYKEEHNIKRNKKDGIERFKAPVDYEKFTGILRYFNKIISNKIITEGAEFKMPLRLGTLRIKKKKIKRTIREDGSIDHSKDIPDWFETKKYWNKIYPEKTKEEIKKIKNKPIIYHLNEHTDGYTASIYWGKVGSNVINRRIYSFIFTRSNNRELAKVLKSNDIPEYYE